MWIWWVVAGLGAGFFSGLFGIGGGIILVPFLTLLLNYPHHTANGTSLVAFLFPTVAFAVLTYYKAGKIGGNEIKAGMVIAAAMMVASPLGAMLAVRLPENILRKAFCLVIIYAAIRLWLKK